MADNNNTYGYEDKVVPNAIKAWNPPTCEPMAVGPERYQGVRSTIDRVREENIASIESALNLLNRIREFNSALLGEGEVPSKEQAIATCSGSIRSISDCLVIDAGNLRNLIIDCHAALDNLSEDLFQ
jgi:hypothetical protein